MFASIALSSSQPGGVRVKRVKSSPYTDRIVAYLVGAFTAGFVLLAILNFDSGKTLRRSRHYCLGLAALGA